MAELTEENGYTRFEFQNFQKVHVLCFYSHRFADSFEFVDLVQKLEYAMQPTTAAFAYVDIDAYPSAVELFKITQLPSVVFRNFVDEEVLALSPTALFARLSSLEAEFKERFAAEQERQFARIATILKSHPIQVFIKGTPQAPKCKFTRQLLAELKPLNVRFGFYDIDNDQGMRHWLKLYTGWKTFPQIFIKGELLGGLDVFRGKVADGTLPIPEEARVEELNSLPEVQKLGSTLILSTGSPNPQSPLAVYLSEQNCEFQYYNTELNAPLLSQLKQRNLDDVELVLKGGQLYTLDQFKQR